MTRKNYQALIVDDEPDLLSLLAISLGRMNINCVKAGDVSIALQKLAEQEFDLCLTDMRLPDGTGLEIVDHIKEQGYPIPIAVITAFGDAKTAVQALKSGAFDYVSKPIELAELQNLINTGLQISDSRNKPSKSVEESALIGKSKPIIDIRTLIAKVSKSLAPVHIFGETGTGKELIARLIHSQGPRADKPFVAVNCGAIPKELMESEFFGHKKGSFTGANQDTEGLFRAANGGTLFLDEIGELPLELQVKLLRTIQEKKVRSIGDTAESAIDLRIVSATNRNLLDLVHSSEFREDFYYRINVIPVHAPALRDRKSDIPDLVDFFVSNICERNHQQIPSIGDETLKRLIDYEYPGNIRELENILERALTLSESGEVIADDLNLPEKVTTSQDENLNENLNENLKLDSATLPIDDQIKAIEADRIVQALKQANGNVTAAAKILGTTFRSLRYRIKKLNIQTR